MTEKEFLIKLILDTYTEEDLKKCSIKELKAIIESPVTKEIRRRYRERNFKKKLKKINKKQEVR